MPAREDELRSVSQASGMVSVQAQCSVSEALDLMKERAHATGRTLREVADATLDRKMRFDTQA